MMKIVDTGSTGERNFSSYVTKIRKNIYMVDGVGVDVNGVELG